jgi:uncharacterized membrane protein
MTLIFTVLLLLAVVLRFFTPKKPNYLFGYQLGSAKKSIEHWRLANKYASNYMIILYSLALILSLIFDYKKYDGYLIVLSILVIGFLVMYFDIESRLKKIENNSSL